VGAIILLLLASHSAAWAQELRYPSDGRLRKLSSIYPEDVTSQIGFVCQQRFSGSQEEWESATSEWRRQNASALTEATRLQASVGSALRKSRPTSIDIDTWAFIVNARFESLAEMDQLLATMGDAQAKPYCESMLTTKFGSFVVDMTDARAAASAAVEDLIGTAH
jgi:hypothetical protein